MNIIIHGRDYSVYVLFILWDFLIAALIIWDQRHRSKPKKVCDDCGQERTTPHEITGCPVISLGDPDEPFPNVQIENPFQARKDRRQQSKPEDRVAHEEHMAQFFDESPYHHQSLSDKEKAMLGIDRPFEGRPICKHGMGWASFCTQCDEESRQPKK